VIGGKSGQWGKKKSQKQKLQGVGNASRLHKKGRRYKKLLAFGRRGKSLGEQEQKGRGGGSPFQHQASPVWVRELCASEKNPNGEGRSRGSQRLISESRRAAHHDAAKKCLPGGYLGDSQSELAKKGNVGCPCEIEK